MSMWSNLLRDLANTQQERQADYYVDRSKEDHPMSKMITMPDGRETPAWLLSDAFDRKGGTLRVLNQREQEKEAREAAALRAQQGGMVPEGAEAPTQMRSIADLKKKYEDFRSEATRQKMEEKYPSLSRKK